MALEFVCFVFCFTPSSGELLKQLYVFSFGALSSLTSPYVNKAKEVLTAVNIWRI